MEFHSSSSLLSLCFYFSTTLLSLSHPPPAPVFLLAQPSALLQHLGQASQPSLDSSPGFTAVLRGIHLNCYGVGQKPGLADADLGLGVGVMSGPGAEGGELLPAILGVRERVMGSSPATPLLSLTPLGSQIAHGLPVSLFIILSSLPGAPQRQAVCFPFMCDQAGTGLHQQELDQCPHIQPQYSCG